MIHGVRDGGKLSRYWRKHVNFEGQVYLVPLYINKAKKKKKKKTIFCKI